MSSETETIILQWEGLAIELRYEPMWSKAAMQAYGEPLAHLQLKTITPAEAPMPISETGYKSMFLLDSDIQEYGSAEKFARAVLDDAARSEGWQAAQVQASQLSLF